MFCLADYDFDLPPELIAQDAPASRSASRLLCVDNTDPLLLTDRIFADLPACLSAGDLLIFNDTRVIKARLLGHKQSGGAVEVLVERLISPYQALCQIRASKVPKPGSHLLLQGGLVVEVGQRREPFFEIMFPSEVLPLLEQHGQLPLPPYIQHIAQAVDEQRYQTVYAREPGAVAAPTAGLHFDNQLLDKLNAQGVRTAFLTLHVGAGTFTPVRAEDVREHKMHSEHYFISQELVDAVMTTRKLGKKIIAVGTTTLRALEACAQRFQGELKAGAGQTDIFIKPGFDFQIVDRLITNFHLPKSSLLILVSAFAGYDVIRSAYAHAIAQRYRFFSYGDAMLLTKVIHDDSAQPLPVSQKQGAQHAATKTYLKGGRRSECRATQHLASAVGCVC